MGDTPPAGLAHGNRTNKMFRPSLATVFNSFYGKIKKLTTRDTMIRLCLKHLYAVYSTIPISEIFQAAERNLMQHFTASQLVVISAVLAHSWSYWAPSGTKRSLWDLVYTACNCVHGIMGKTNGF